MRPDVARRGIYFRMPSPPPSHSISLSLASCTCLYRTRLTTHRGSVLNPTCTSRSACFLSQPAQHLLHHSTHHCFSFFLSVTRCSDGASDSSLHWEITPKKTQLCFSRSMWGVRRWICLLFSDKVNHSVDKMIQMETRAWLFVKLSVRNVACKPR